MSGLAIRRGYVDAPEGQLHYREAGNGRALLLLHPSPASSAMFDPILPLLARAGFRAVALDVPGFGGSYHPSETPTMEQYADASMTAANALGFESFDLFGNHGGATIALLVAAANPHRVGRLVLWGVGLGDDNFSPSPAGAAPPPKGGFAQDGSDLAGFWSRGFAFQAVRNVPAFVLRRMTDLLLAGYDNPGHGPGDRVDHRALISRVNQPVLVMSGHHDEVWEDSRTAARLLPDGRFEAIEAASVYVAEEFPEQLAAAIERFLDRDVA